jgi:hypothetical protein
VGGAGQNVPPLTKLQQEWALLLGLLVFLVIVSIALMRRFRRFGRRGWSMSASLIPDEPQPARRGPIVDPWAESARRLGRQGAHKKGDTVDLDPEDLSRGDIETDPDAPVDPEDDL